MRKLGWVIGTILAAALSGCGSSLSDSTAPGPVDKGLYQDAVLDNEQRLAGEDRRVVPLYKTPLEAIGVGLDYCSSGRSRNFFDYISHDNAAYAAQENGEYQVARSCGEKECCGWWISSSPGEAFI